MKIQSAADALVARMLSFEGSFDGYPSMSCADEGLIEAAAAEAQTSGYILMSYLASVHATTRSQYDSCKAFMLAAVETAWSCNMIEGDNPVQAEIDSQFDETPYQEITL